MAKAIDYISDSTGDLLIKDGDFVKGDATLQHQRALLLAHKGEYKQSPTIGVGISSYMLDDLNPGELKKAIQEEFENDGMVISKLQVKSLDDVTVTAEYGN